MVQQIPFSNGIGVTPGLGLLEVIQAENVHAEAGAAAQSRMRQMVCSSGEYRHPAVVARDRIGPPLSRAIFTARKTPRKKMSVVPRMISRMSKCRAIGPGHPPCHKSDLGPRFPGVSRPGAGQGAGLR
jgi:hypothetical protein